VNGDSSYSGRVRQDRENQRGQQVRDENHGTREERSRVIAERAREARERAQWRVSGHAEQRRASRESR
jgi:hypothetical protein